MFSRSHYLKLMRIVFNQKSFRAVASLNTTKFHNTSIKSLCPAALGFSVFTWLGFKEKTPEDDLIENIKHSIIFIRRTQFDKAEQLLHVTLRQAQQMHHELAITYIYDLMANLALQTSQLDKAKKLFVAVSQRLLGEGVKDDDLRIVHISVKLARISHLQNEHNTAKIGFEWCLNKLKEHLLVDPNPDRVILIALAEDWYGRLFLDTKQYKDGVQLMVSSLKRMDEFPEKDEQEIVLQLNDIGTVYERMDDYDNSISYLKQALERGTRLEDFDELGVIYVNLGRVYLKKNMIDEARKMCGYGWRLGVDKKNEDIKNEATLCIKEINNAA